MKKFHNIISIIFQPLLIPTYGVLLLVNLDVFNSLMLLTKVIIVGGTFLFTGIMPALPILLMLRSGEVNDLFISKREERTIPYLFAFFSYVVYTFFLYRVVHFPMFLVAMGIGVSISILLITLINLKWKISAHLSGIGGLAGGIFGISYRMGYNHLGLLTTILALSALVAFSRIELKAHTPGQTLAGFLLGFITVFVPCVLL
jgi:membrane-associated phospholipid phosphatase